MHAPVLVTPPAEEPVTLAEAKLQCRIEAGDTDQDALLELYLDAAVSHLDGYSGVLGRCLVQQTWRQDFDGLCQALRLPMPALSVTSVELVDEAGAPTVVAGASYELQHDALGSFVRMADGYASPVTLTESRGVRVTFVAGYGAAASVPSRVRLAILLLVSHWYQNREAVNVGNITSLMPLAFDELIRPLRRVGV